MGNMDISALLTVVGIVTVLTNIIVQVLKQITWDKIPTNLVALMVSLVLTLVAGGAYAQLNGITVTWYMAAAAVVVGFMCAYAAMFGFDKLQEVLKGAKSEK
jgi:divalent metal cation (Fe/Co/Zn/Cd) transporter